MRGWKGIGVVVLAVGTLGGSIAATPDRYQRAPAESKDAASVRVPTLSAVDAPTASAGLVSSNLSNYVPLNPFRILDTRSGTCVQCSGLALGPGAIRKVQLTGVIGLRVGTDPIPSTAMAVVLNVTEVAGSTQSLLTIYPFGTALPRASNLNFGAGTVIPNLVTVPLGQGGAVNIYNALGTVNVVADVEGYFEPEPPSDVTGEFHPIAPVRVCDTRITSPTPACKAKGAVGTTPLVVNVTGAGDDAISATGAEAAVLNLTGVAGTKPTLLSVFPTNSSGSCTYNASHPPPFSTLNLAAGEVRANRMMVELGPAVTGGADTSLCVYNAAGTINVILDANGWFGSGTAAAGAQYQAITPTRICDTRTGSGLPCAGQTLGALRIDTAVVAGEGGLPATAASSPALAVIANLTAIAPTKATYLTVYPANQTGHSVSDVSLSAGEVLPNLAVVQVDTTGDAHNGDVDLFNAAGTVNAIIDIEGWFQLTYASGISGTVSDTQTPAQPIGDAGVTYSGTGTTRGSGATTTDASGAYTLTNVPPGTYTVDVTATGFTSPAPQTVTVATATVSTASVSLTATSSINGSVFDTQTPAQPIAGATVTYAGTNGNTAAGSTTTDSNGDYAFGGVSPGTYVVAGSDSRGYNPSTPQTVIVTAGDAATADVSLTATSSITGAVMDDEAVPAPVYDAAVSYTGGGGNTASGTTTTNTDGTYTFSGIAPGTYTITATDTDGYAPPSSSPQMVTVGVGTVATAPGLVLASEHMRLAFQQPFTSSSIWNVPIGSGAQYSPANLLPATHRALVSDQHVIVMTPTAPLTPIDVSAGGQTGDRCTTTGAPPVATVPIPADFLVGTSPGNDPVAAVGTDGNTLFEGEPFARCTAGGPGTVPLHGYETTPGGLDGNGLVGIDGGSDLSSLGGAIRLGDLENGSIDHAMQIDVDAPNLYFGSTSACHVWPATKCDGNASTMYTGNNPLLTAGSLLALPQSLNLKSLGLETPPGMILAAALQDYGAYIANDTIVSVNNIVTEDGPSGSVAGVLTVTPTTCTVTQVGEFQTLFGFPFETCPPPNAGDPWTHDIETIFANLAIVTNNTASSIGGGGMPIVAPAPPL